MISWNEACSISGYDPKVSAPASEYIYFAYKNGECQSFTYLDDAKTFSDNTERGVSNKDDIDAFWKKRRTLETKALNVWKNALREEYNHLSRDMFGICYSKAYEDGHHAGYDEVANYMNSSVEFAENIMKVLNGRV